MLNVVIDFDDFCSFNWWYFEVKFILLNILFLLKLVVSFLIVGVWCYLCNMVLFNFFMFIVFVFFLGMGIVGEIYGVGFLVMFLIIF